MKISVQYQRINVARRFRKAVYKRQRVGRSFDSAREAAEHYNLRNCDYYFYKETDEPPYEEIIKEVHNIRGC